ncbi:MAG: sulfatase-like hydrolase/transferase [Planctomycetota bacterium]
MYTRRQFLRITGFGALAAALPKSLLAAENKQNMPNILFIMSDDHTSQAISAYGGMLADVCPTPNIDRIAKEGMLFKNCFVTNSICTPSRAAIFTGKYSHINGVYKFTALDQSQPTLPKFMQKAGYNTSFIGKYHLHSNPVGLDYWSVLPGQGQYHEPEFIEMGDESPTGRVQNGKRTEYQGHSSDVIADKALDYLKNKRDKDKPFMFFCHFKAPHDTWEFAERYRSFLEDVEIPEPPNLFDDYEGRSDMLKKQLQYIGSEWGNHTNFREETAHLEGKERKKMQYQLYMKKYLRCVKGVDDNVGRILDYLDESGLAENTLIMYTGDQGFFLGEHGLYDKRIMYEEALRMPFLVRWPGHIKPGSTSKGMILNVDFAPTIMDAAGIRPDPDMQGRSFVELLMGTTPSDWRKSMYYRYYYSHFETEPHLGVRTHTHKLIYFDRIDQWEMYDLVKDPHEMNNVYNDPEYKQLVTELKKELKRLQTELGDDPKDIGDYPNGGDLGPKPLHVFKEDLNIGKGNVSILTRFRTNLGGTIFSKCSERGSYDGPGSKMLFLTEDTLFYDDSWHDEVIEGDYADNKWHTVAVVYHGRKLNIYVDGELKFTTSGRISKDKQGHIFKIGAGAIDHGSNFKGDISHVLVYEEPLKEESIKEFTKGKLPESKPALEWTN